MNIHNRAIILDLDNTVYPVSSIQDELFNSVVNRVISVSNFSGDIEQLKSMLVKKSFQYVAEYFKFSNEVTQNLNSQLQNIVYEKPIKPFPDYQYLKSLSVAKYLVTSGFSKLQKSKIEQLNIANDFNGIYVVDPLVSSKNKQDIFEEIALTNRYLFKDIFVIGDDMESEIKAGQQLGMNCILYDKYNVHSNTYSIPKITNFEELDIFL